MNPILFRTLELVKQRRRRCPECGHVQSASPDERLKPIRCRRCGATIPPQRKAVPLTLRADS